MQFHLPTAELYVPDALSETEALARTTHLAVAAHQDDIEIMAIDGILQCYQHPHRWFAGVVVTNGAGPARAGVYTNFSGEQMVAVRGMEQKKAALIGDYGAQVLLDYPSSVIKDPTQRGPLDDLCLILEQTRPDVVYTHNLADKHPTHVAVALRAIEALRIVSPAHRPNKVYGCEVWRDLNWMLDEEKVVFDTSQREHLQEALLGVYDSQIYAAKRYDLATMGRRRANATYFESHGLDQATGLVFAMDLTPLIEDPSRSIPGYVQGYIDRFAEDVYRLIGSLS